MEQEFAAFYLAARDDCLRIVLISTGDRDLAEELVAEAFTRAWVSWAKLRGHPARQAWVVRTALNVGVSLWRLRRREVPLDDRDLPDEPGAWVPGIDPALVAAIRKLPRRQQQVLLLRVFFDLDEALAARVLGLAPGTVSAHLHRALAKLRSGYPAAARKEINS